MNKKRELLVKDIYIGKPDAKDEIISQNSDEFLRSFVVPPNFDVGELLENDKMFITGYKGTGKTALLLYLDNECNKRDVQSCTSFILFKSHYGNVQRLDLERVSKNIIKTIDIDQDILESEDDFEYIWRWVIFKQIIEDNTYHNFGIFENDENWNEFKNTVEQILSEKSIGNVFKMPKKIAFGVSCTADQTGKQTITPKIELDFESTDNLQEYSLFVSLIEEATRAFIKLKRSDIPYYIFIDELEAYYSFKNTLQRDLRMIRDLIITVKFINDAMAFAKFKNAKVICSVRNEIVNSICNFVTSKEVNKIVGGFSCPLIWNYGNNNSYAHPIFEIWLKRIQLSEENYGIEMKSYKDTYEKWFCEEISSIPTVTYILNSTWNKPRDIVRFLNATKNSQHAKREMYTPAIFNDCIIEYSDESIKELKEELNALYTPDEINVIFSCLTGYKPHFSYQELEERISKYFKGSFLTSNLSTVLIDLYRVGVIGNISISSNNDQRWDYKGYQGLVLDDEWNIIVHRALWKTLSITPKHGRVASIIDKNSKLDLYNKVVECTVAKVVKGFAIVHFDFCEEQCYGSIHVSKLSTNYIGNIFEHIKTGDKLTAKVLKYNEKHLKWEMTCIDMQ